MNSEHCGGNLFQQKSFTRSLFMDIHGLSRTILPELELFQQLGPIKCLGTFHPKRIFSVDATNKPSRCFFQNIPDMCKTTQFSTSQLVKLRSLQTCLEPRPSGGLDMTTVEMVWSYMPSICLGTDTHILLDHQLLCCLESSCWFVASYDTKRGNKALRKIFKRQFLSTKIKTSSIPFTLNSGIQTMKKENHDILIAQHVTTTPQPPPKFELRCEVKDPTSLMKHKTFHLCLGLKGSYTSQTLWGTPQKKNTGLVGGCLT